MADAIEDRARCIKIHGGRNAKQCLQRRIGIKVPVGDVHTPEVINKLGQRVDGVGREGVRRIVDDRQFVGFCAEGGIQGWNIVDDVIIRSSQVVCGDDLVIEAIVSPGVDEHVAELGVRTASDERDDGGSEESGNLHQEPHHGQPASKLFWKHRKSKIVS